MLILEKYGDEKNKDSKCKKKKKEHPNLVNEKWKNSEFIKMNKWNKFIYKKEGILQVKLPAAHSWKHLELLNSNMLLPPSIDPSSTHHSSSFILRWCWWQQVEQGLQMFSSSATPPGPPVESEALPDQMKGFEVSPEVFPRLGTLLQQIHVEESEVWFQVLRWVLILWVGAAGTLSFGLLSVWL